MNFDDLNRLKDIFAKEIVINDDNVDQMSIDLTKLASKYLKLYIKEIRIKKQLEIERDAIYGKLYDHYKFHFDKSLDTIKEVEAYIKSDQKYYDKALELSNQEVVTTFLEQALDIINKAGYSVKNYIELQKLRNGLV